MRLQISSAFIKVSTSEQQLVSKRCLCIRTIIKASIFKFFFVSQDIIKFINRNRNINDRLCFYRENGGAANVLNVFDYIT